MTWKKVARVIMKGRHSLQERAGRAPGKQRAEIWRGLRRSGREEAEHREDQNWLCQGQGGEREQMQEGRGLERDAGDRGGRRQEPGKDTALGQTPVTLASVTILLASPASLESVLTFPLT